MLATFSFLSSDITLTSESEADTFCVLVRVRRLLYQLLNRKKDKADRNKTYAHVCVCRSYNRSIRRSFCGKSLYSFIP